MREGRHLAGHSSLPAPEHTRTQAAPDASVDTPRWVDPLRTTRPFAGQPQGEPELRDGRRRLTSARLVKGPGRNVGRETPDEASFSPQNPHLQGSLTQKKRMKGLEPSTFCMASARGRTRPFAPVRSNGLFAGVLVQASEPERTRANVEPCHSCHGTQSVSAVSLGRFVARSQRHAGAEARRNGARTDRGSSC